MPTYFILHEQHEYRMSKQTSRTEETKTESSAFRALGVLFFAIAGFILVAWFTFMSWEILKAPLDLGMTVSISGTVGALGFALLGFGVWLIVRK
jgi:hypothetical protein